MGAEAALPVAALTSAGASLPSLQSVSSQSELAIAVEKHDSDNSDDEVLETLAVTKGNKDGDDDVGVSSKELKGSESKDKKEKRRNQHKSKNKGDSKSEHTIGGHTLMGFCTPNMKLFEHQ